MSPTSRRPISPLTLDPTAEPSTLPTQVRTPAPSIGTSGAPTAALSNVPSIEPSASPIVELSMAPSIGGVAGRVEPTLPPNVTLSQNETEPLFFNETEPLSSNHTDAVIGTVTFSIVVKAGKLNHLPLKAYSSKLIMAVDSLALEVVEDMERSMDTNGYNRRRRILNSLDVDVHTAHHHRFLERLRVNLPGSITHVQTSDFTSTPQVSASNNFLGGACPSTFGDVDADRCEEITASISLFVGDGYIAEIQNAFQAGLEDGVTSGRLKNLFTETYPKSRVKIVSGEVILDTKEDASMSQEAGLDVSRHMSAGAIVGIILALLAVLLAILLGLRSCQRWLKPNMKEDSTAYTIDKESVDVNTLPESDGLARSDQDGEDNDNWSTPTNVSKKPDVVFLSSDLGQYIIPLDDNLSYASAEGSKNAHMRDASVVSGMSGRIPSSLGSTSTAGFISEARVELHDGKSKHDIPGLGKIEDLEATILAAIQTGDWEAVGATAAVLASQPDCSFSGRHTIASLDEQSRDGSTKSITWQSAIDATKAAELDQLIEQGNWAGIIDAAARYESATKGNP